MPLDHLRENADLPELLKGLPRSKDQVNSLNEADAEILKLGDSNFLVSTIDSISEEVQLGLYEDPYTVGWMAATV